MLVLLLAVVAFALVVAGGGGGCWLSGESLRGFNRCTSTPAHKLRRQRLIRRPNDDPPACCLRTL